MAKGYLVEASALPATVGLARPRIAISTSLLRLRSDEQLVTLFRDGNEDAFRIIHDRYRTRLLAYARQMLSGSGQDAEDALQEIFVRAYYGLRANQRDLALRPWLYRIAHNRCIDDLRRHFAVPVPPVETSTPEQQDPAVRVEQRDALRRLIADVRRLPEQQRSALLMRELSGMSYGDVAGALAVSVPAVKSLLVRARVGLAAASEARNTACAQIREDLILAHDRGVRASGLARRHMHECSGCREFRSDIRGVSRQLAALTPTLGPIGVIANLLGFGSGGGAAASGGVAGGGAAAASGAAGTGAAASAGLLAGGAGHVVTLLAAAVVTAGGAVEIQKTFSAPVAHRVHHHAARADSRIRGVGASTAAQAQSSGAAPMVASVFGAPSSPSASPSVVNASSPAAAGAAYAGRGRSHGSGSVPISQLLDPDQLLYSTNSSATAFPGSGTTPVTVPAGTTPAGTPRATGTPAPGVSPGTPTATGSPTPSPSGTGTGSGSGTGAGTGGGTGTGTGTGSGTGTGTPSSTPPTSSGTPSNGTSATGTGSGTPAASGTGRDSSTSAGTAGTTSSTRSQTNPPAVIGKTIGAGAVSAGRVVSFVTTKRRTHHHGFALGTLLAR